MALAQIVVMLAFDEAQVILQRGDETGRQHRDAIMTRPLGSRTMISRFAKSMSFTRRRSTFH